MWRKKRGLFIILILFLCLLTSLAYAITKDTDFQYIVLEDGTAEITKYIGNSTTINFPAKLGGCMVSSIGDSAFEGCSVLRRVYYVGSSSVTRIGNRAFKGCVSLESIDIPGGTKIIGDSAFEGCSKMRKAYYMGSSAVVSIGEKAFMGCTSLESIDIPKGVSIIPVSAFEECSSLRKAYYMGSSAVEVIDDYAFRNCSSLESIDASKVLVEIGESAFEGCTNLRRFYYLRESKVTFGVNAFARCPQFQDMPKKAIIDESKLLSIDMTPSPTTAVLVTETINLVKPSDPNGWICPGCGYDAIGNFCNNCGSPRPEEIISLDQNASDEWVCANCGYNAIGNYCNNCGSKRSDIAFNINTTATPMPTSTPNSTPTPKPTMQHVPAAKWTGDLKTLSSGTYYVGIDLPVGTYLFRQVDGDDCVPVINVYNSNQEKVVSGSADKNGCVLNLKDGQIVKISWTKACVSLFDTAWTENETKLLPSGMYYIGTDIPAGSYHFVKIKGDDYTPVLYVYNADDLSEKVDSGSASETGCALNLKEGQVLKITWTAAIASKLDLEWEEGEKMLPSGTYYIGIDLPAGIYHFKHIEGDDYTPVLYVYNADNIKEKVDSGTASDIGCILSLRDNQVLKITWTAAITSKFNTAFANGEKRLLPSGTYYIGTDLPAGTFRFMPIEGDDYTPVLYVYNADDLENRIDSASVYSNGCSMNLKDGQVLKIIWTGTYATLSNSVGITSGSLKSTTEASVTTTPQPVKMQNDKATEAPETQTSKFNVSLESVVAYMLSPNDSSLHVNVVELGGGSFTASSAGKSYFGYYFAEDNSYMIELVLSGSGSYDSVESPFDFTSNGFKNLLSFLLEKNSRSVASIYPILGDIYGARDSKGTTYMIQVAYSESMIVVSLITWD